MFAFPIITDFQFRKREPLLGWKRVLTTTAVPRDLGPSTQVDAKTDTNNLWTRAREQRPTTSLAATGFQPTPQMTVGFLCHKRKAGADTGPGSNDPARRNQESGVLGTTGFLPPADYPARARRVLLEPVMSLQFFSFVRAGRAGCAGRIIQTCPETSVLCKYGLGGTSARGQELAFW